MLSKPQKIITVGIVGVLAIGGYILFGGPVPWGGWGAGEVGDDWQMYTNETYGFSFKAPDDFTFGTVPEGLQGESVIAMDSDRELQFQIFVQSFDEEGEVPTAEWIRESLPELRVDGAQEVVLGDGKHALIFRSAIEGEDNTREVWFARRAHLYQVIGPAKNDTLMATVLSTLRFD